MAFQLRFADQDVTMRQKTAHGMAYKRSTTYRRRRAAERREATFRLAVWALFTLAVLVAISMGMRP